MGLREELRCSLPTDHEYRHAYADEILDLLVCTQIRVLREQQRISQGQLAKAIGTTQTAVSRLESLKYSAWNIRTLKKIAKAFDLRLRVTFEDFGTLWQDVSSLNRRTLERARRIEEDPEFGDRFAGETSEASTTSDVSGPSVVTTEESVNHAADTVISNVLEFRRKKTIHIADLNYSDVRACR